jgi:hypothetical protein
MSKIPVGETISAAYEFTFSNFLSVFGIAWLPYLLFAVVVGGSVFLLAPDLPRLMTQDQFDPMSFVALRHVIGVFWLASLIVGAIVAVGIQRKALGLHPGPVFFYFSLGEPVWRMIFARFLAALVIILVGLLTAGAGVAVWFAAGNFLPAYAVPVRVSAIIVAVLWLIYMIVRLSFFLPSVVVAEGRLGLGRSWMLGGGNFWRIVVVFVAVLAPVAIAFGMVRAMLLGSFLPPMMFTHAPANQDFHAVMQQIFRTVWQQFRALGPLILVVQGLESIVFMALINGAIAKAYLAVAPKSASGPPAHA